MDGCGPGGGVGGGGGAERAVEWRGELGVRNTYNSLCNTTLRGLNMHRLISPRAMICELSVPW